MSQLRDDVAKADALKKKKDLQDGPKAAFGYGGKFGVQSDRYAIHWTNYLHFRCIIKIFSFPRMDSSAVGHDYVAHVEKHASQVDYRTGFGGKFGVQSDRVDKVITIFDNWNSFIILFPVIIFISFLVRCELRQCRKTSKTRFSERLRDRFRR